MNVLEDPAGLDELRRLGARSIPVLSRGDANAIWTFTQTDSGEHDVEALEQLVRLLPADDVRRAIGSARLRRLSQDD